MAELRGELRARQFSWLGGGESYWDVAGKVLASQSDFRVASIVRERIDIRCEMVCEVRDFTSAVLAFAGDAFFLKKIVKDADR